MGMSYRYAGSASYPRFDYEVGQIAALLGAEKTKKPEGGRLFVFPETVPEILRVWLNNIYEPYGYLEAMAIWKEVEKYPEIEKISCQIWYELITSISYEEGWEIYH